MFEGTGRILSIDFGEKRIGIALSDPLGITAQPLKVIVRKRGHEELREIADLVEAYQVEKIVIGLPLNMDGSEGFMVKSMRAFSERLGRICDIEIIEFDERLTSLQAGKALSSAEIRGRKKKKRIDSISAQIILQTYLDSLSR